MGSSKGRLKLETKEEFPCVLWAQLTSDTQDPALV